MNKIYIFDIFLDEWKQDSDPVFKIMVFRIRIRPKMDRIRNPGLEVIDLWKNRVQKSHAAVSFNLSCLLLYIWYMVRAMCLKKNREITYVGADIIAAAAAVSTATKKGLAHFI